MSEHEVTVLLHLLGAGVMIGIIFFSLVLSIKKPLEVEDFRRLNFIRHFGIFVVFFMLITGLHLVQNDFDYYKANSIFWTKMGLIIVDGLIAERIIKAKMELVMKSGIVDDNTRRTLPIWAWISTLVIFSVVTLGYISHEGIFR